MTWTKTYNKYKDTELMKEFSKWRWNNDGLFKGEGNQTIKDIWGYLICFAVTKGLSLNINIGKWEESPSLTFFDFVITDIGTENIVAELEDFLEKPEQAMLWCAEKFFEMAK